MSLADRTGHAIAARRSTTARRALLYSHHVIDVEQVRRRIESALPGSRVEVATFAGHDHFQAVVEAPQFEGKSLVEQHRMVYAALEGWLGGAMHALALKTRVPARPER
jgi:stress-induced morphogen